MVERPDRDVERLVRRLVLWDGILRAQYRDGDTETTLLEPGEVYRYEIDLMVTGSVFRKGHSIRLEIASSNFPRFDRNLNTGDTAKTPRSESRARPSCTPGNTRRT